MKLSKLDKVFLLMLNKRGGPYLNFSLFRDLKVPMADFLRSTIKLEKVGMIDIKDNKIYLKSEGFKYVVTQLEKRSFDKCSIPSNMLRPYQIAVDSPYIPAVSRLDQRLNPRLMSGIM